MKNVKKKFSFPGYTTVRLMRRTPQGTFLFGTSTQLVEGDSTGAVLWKKTIPGAKNVYQVVRLKSGNILVSTGYGATLLEINSNGDVVKTFGGAE